MLPLSYTLAVDGAVLDVREMRPGDVSSPECIAVVSHPYGPLGGTQGDPTVVRLVRVFLDLGCRVLTYDARGVGASTGRTSWTQRVEADDYQAVVDYALSGQRGATTVYCCGYSAGAVSASFARVSAPHTARHVLVSYPLGVLWALATLRAGKCREEVKRLSGEGSPLLLVHGSADQCTGAASYRSWNDELAGAPHTRAELVDGADHFWARGRGETADTLARLILDWAKALPPHPG